MCMRRDNFPCFSPVNTSSNPSRQGLKLYELLYYARPLDVEKMACELEAVKENCQVMHRMICWTICKMIDRRSCARGRGKLASVLPAFLNRAISDWPEKLIIATSPLCRVNGIKEKGLPEVVSQSYMI